MAKTWISDHGRASKWKKLDFPKKESGFRTEYFVSDIPDRIKKHQAQDASKFRIVIQNVTGTINNIRTVYACVLHKKYLTNNSLHNLFIGKDEKQLFFYLGILNSFVLDWQARIKVATNLNKFILESFIMPDYYSAEISLRNQLSNISFWLSNISSDFKDNSFNYPHIKFSSREEAIVSINVISAKLYGLTYHELEYILSYFNLVNDNLKSAILAQFRNY